MFGLLTCKFDPKITLKSLSVDCHVNNLLISCTSEFLYKNEEDEDTEALFSFPLDNNCVVYYLEAVIDNKTIIGVCKEVEEAKSMYEAAKEKGHKAAMIEMNRSMMDVFKCRIGNFPKHSEAKIKIKFAMELQLNVARSEIKDVDRFKLALPLILRPRYTPSEYDGDREVYQVANKYEYHFKATVTGTKVIHDISSINHELEIKYTTDNKTSAEIILKSEYDGTKDLDINIDYISMREPSVFFELGTGSDQFAGKKAEGAFYESDVAMINFLPKFTVPDSENQNCKIEIVIIVDRSGSMDGSNIERARECLLIFLKSLPINCKFQIYGFGSEFDKAFNTSQLYDDQSMNIALTYQKNLDASFGGTELMQPLRDMYNTPLGDDYSRIAFLLTDGDVGNQDEVINLVKKHNNKTRLFTVGIGDGVSTSLVDKVAKAGCGKSAFVRNSLQLSSSVIKLLDIALNCDHFTNSKIQWKCPDNVSIITVPSTIPPVFSNHFLTVFCMINGLKEDDKVECTLTGDVNERSVSFSMDIDLNNAIVDEEFRVHRMLGKYKIEEMAIEIDSGKKDIKKALIELSLQVNIVTNFTTFVAIDPEVSEKKKTLTNEEKPLDYFGVLFPETNESSFRCFANQYGSILDSSDDNLNTPRLNCKKSRVKNKGFALSFSMLKPSFNIFKKDSKTKKRLPKEKKENEQKKTSENVDVILEIITLQKIDGSWDVDVGIISKIGINKSDFTNHKPDGINAKVWMTAVLYQFLVQKNQSRETEWRLIARKAKQWIESSLNNSNLLKELFDATLRIF